MNKDHQLKTMERYLVLFHESARRAFDWIERCPAYCQDSYIMDRFGYIPYNVFEANVEQYFADELNHANIPDEDKRDIYRIFCKFFKNKELTNGES